MKKLILAAFVALFSVQSFAQSYSIGISGGHGSFFYSNTVPVYVAPPVYHRHHHHHSYSNYVPVMPGPTYYVQPAPVVTYVQPYNVYRGGTHYVPDGYGISCSYPKEYDRVCNSNGTFCVTC